METSASFEARYAPSLYPTGGPKGHLQKRRGEESRGDRRLPITDRGLL